MAVYLVALVLSLILLRLNRNNKILSQLFCILPLIVVAGCRDATVGTDTSGYPTDVFEMCREDSIGNIFLMVGYGYVEPVYILLAYLVSRFTDDFNWFLTISHLIIFINVLRAIRVYRITPVIGIFVFFCFFFNTSLNVARQAISVSFIPIAAYYYFEGSTKKAIINFLLACSFHTSSIFFGAVVIMHWLINKNMSFFSSSRGKAVLIICILLFLVFFSSIIDFMGTHGIIAEKYIERYGDSEKYGSSLPVSSIYLNFLNLYIFYKLKKKFFLLSGNPLFDSIDDGVNKKLWCVLEYSQLLALLLCFTGSISMFLTRITMPFLIFNVFILLTLLSLKRSKIVYTASILYFFYWVMVTYKNLGDVLPYRSAILGIN